MVDAEVEFPTGFPKSNNTCSPLWHLSCLGEDINGGKVPYLASPPASDSLLWHMPHPGMDINGKKVPYLAGKTDSFFISRALVM